MGWWMHIHTGAVPHLQWMPRCRIALQKGCCPTLAEGAKALVEPEN